MEDSSTQPRLAAVILAAGMSRRMGSPKALLDLGGQPVILHVVKTVGGLAGVEPIIVVTGHQPELIHKALAGQKVRFAHNPDYEAGQMLSSVKVGVSAVAGSCEAFFLMLLDQPLVTAKTLETLWTAWLIGQPPLLVPQFRGLRGHPILIAARCIPEISGLPRDGSLRDFVEQNRSHIKIVDVDDPGICTDLDTPEDYQQLLNPRNAK